MISAQPSEVGSQIIVILQSRKLRLKKVRPRKLMAELGLELKFLDSHPAPAQGPDTHSASLRALS